MTPRRYGPRAYVPIHRRPPLIWPNGAHVALALAKRVRRRPRTALAVLWVGERCGEVAERMLGERH